MINFYHSHFELLFEIRTRMMCLFGSCPRKCIGHACSLRPPRKLRKLLFVGN
jgi:hypothetical protein